jgi:hypothetical protein
MVGGKRFQLSHAHHQVATPTHDSKTKNQSLTIDDRQWDTHKERYMAGCRREQVEPNQRVMRAVEKPAEVPGLQEQRTLEGWSVAKESRWSKQGLMEHIIELVVVDDQVRHATFIYVTKVDVPTRYSCV